MNALRSPPQIHLIHLSRFSGPLYGATGTGDDTLVRTIVIDGTSTEVTRDRFAFHQALNHIRLAGGGHVFVPRGDYIINKTLSIGSNTTMTGEGSGLLASSQGLYPPTNLIYTGDSTAVSVTGSTHVIKHVCLENLCISGENADCLLQLTGAKNNTFSDLMLDGRTTVGGEMTIGANCGLRLDADDGLAVYYNSFFSFHIEYCSTGVHIDGVADSAVKANANSFYSFDVRYCDTGYAIDDGRSDSFFGCVAENNNVVGIRLSGQVNRIQFFGGHSENPSGLNIDSATADNPLLLYGTRYYTDVYDPLKIQEGSLITDYGAQITPGYANKWQTLSAGIVEVDCMQGLNVKINLTSDTTITEPLNPTPGAVLRFHFIQSSGWSVTFDGSSKFKLAGGSFSVSTTVNAMDTISFLCSPDLRWHEIGRSQDNRI